MKYIIYLTTRQDRETGEISQNAFRDEQKAIKLAQEWIQEHLKDYGLEMPENNDGDIFIDMGKWYMRDWRHEKCIDVIPVALEDLPVKLH